MDAFAQQRPRNSRWSRDPILNDGTPVAACITDRDVEIFKLLSRYRYLPSDDIHAFVGGGLVHLTRRLDLLQRKPNAYLNRPHQQRENAEANHRRLIYELDERGSRVLRDRGLPIPSRSYHRNFAHELMVCRITASIELGIRADSTLRLITWTEILASDRTPQATRIASQPERIPVTYEVRNERCRAEVSADAVPFGIERSDSGSRSFLFFPGIEADCASEPVDTNDVDRSSIYKKFAAYRAIVSQDIHRAHFGFPNFFVPFITTNKARMESMMKLLNRITDSKGSKSFLFKTFPAFTSFEKPPASGGHVLTEPWQRVGFPDLYLSKP
jgi:Replication-relaxation